MKAEEIKSLVLQGFKEYIGTKQIMAKPFVDQGQDGYLVVYEDGYRSWSPKEVFDKAYQQTDKLSFSHALELIKQGHSVQRAGWNGKGLAVKRIVREGIEPFMVIHNTTTDVKNTWVPSISDLFAEDWSVL